MNLENKVNMLVDSYLEPPKLRPKDMQKHIQDIKDELFKPHLIRFVFNAVCPRLLRFMDEEKALGVLEAMLNGYIIIPNMEYLYNSRDISTLVPTINMLNHYSPVVNNVNYLFEKMSMYRQSGVKEVIVTNMVPFIMLSQSIMSGVITNIMPSIYMKNYIKLIFAPLTTLKVDTNYNNITITVDDYEHNKEVLIDILDKNFKILSKRKKEKLLSKKFYLETLMRIKNEVYNSYSSYIAPKIQLLYPVKSMRNVKAEEFLNYLGVNNIPPSVFKTIHTNRDVYNMYITYRDMSADMLTFEEFEDKFIPFCDGNPDGFQLVGEGYLRLLKKLKSIPMEVVNVPDYYYEVAGKNCFSVCIDVERVMDFCKDLDMFKEMIYDLYLYSQYWNLSALSSSGVIKNSNFYVHFLNVDNEAQKHIHQIVESADIFLKDKYKYKTEYKHDIINKYGRVKA